MERQRHPIVLFNSLVIALKLNINKNHPFILLLECHEITEIIILFLTRRVANLGALNRVSRHLDGIDIFLIQYLSSEAGKKEAAAKRSGSSGDGGAVAATGTSQSSTSGRKLRLVNY